jgi:hypothetical protein
MRLRTVSTDPNGEKPHLEVADVFEANKVYHIVVTYNFKWECIYVNGRKTICDYRIQGDFSAWDASCKLVIGNEATGGRAWLGEIFFAAIYDRPLSSVEVKNRYKSGLDSHADAYMKTYRNGQPPLKEYLFSEQRGVDIFDTGKSPFQTNLHIPQKIHYSAKARLSKESLTENRVDRKDILLNIFGFIPLGCLLHRYLKTKYNLGFKHYFLILMVGLSVSIGCELLQLFLPSRHPSIIDVATNLTGLSGGIIISKFIG